MLNANFLRAQPWPSIAPDDDAPDWERRGAADADPVARAQSDRRAFGLLYDRYADPVYRSCSRRLGDRKAAGDATSLVFAKALAALPKYREHGAFAAWLFAIAARVVADAHRQRDRRPEQPLDLTADRPDPAPDASPERVALVVAQIVADQGYSDGYVVFVEEGDRWLIDDVWTPRG